MEAHEAQNDEQVTGSVGREARNRWLEGEYATVAGIKGIDYNQAVELVDTFGSCIGLTEAPREVLEDISGIGPEVAHRLQHPDGPVHETAESGRATAALRAKYAKMNRIVGGDHKGRLQVVGASQFGVQMVGSALRLALAHPDERCDDWNPLYFTIPAPSAIYTELLNRAGIPESAHEDVPAHVLERYRESLLEMSFYYRYDRGFIIDVGPAEVAL